MEVSGQLHVPAVLPPSRGEMALPLPLTLRVTTAEEAELVANPVWTP